MAARCLIRDTKPQIDFAVLCEVFARFLSVRFREICFVSSPSPGAFRSRTAKSRLCAPHWPHGKILPLFKLSYYETGLTSRPL